MCRAISSCWVVIFNWFYALYWKFELVVVGGFGDRCGGWKLWEVRGSWWCCQGWWWNSSRSGTLGSSNLFCSFCEGLYYFCQIAGINCIFFSCIGQIDRIRQIMVVQFARASAKHPSICTFHNHVFFNASLFKLFLTHSLTMRNSVLLSA